LEDFSQALVDHGFAVVAAIALFISLTATFRFLLGSLRDSVNAVATRVVEENRHLRADLVARAESTHAVTIQLVDRIRKLEETRLRSLEDSVLRVEMLHRIANELPPEVARTGRSNSQD